MKTLIYNLLPERSLGELQPGDTFAIEHDPQAYDATCHYVVTRDDCVITSAVDGAKTIGRRVLRCDNGTLDEWAATMRVRPTKTCLVDIAG